MGRWISILCFALLAILFLSSNSLGTTLYSTEKSSSRLVTPQVIKTNTDPLFVDAYVETKLNIFTVYFDVDIPGMVGDYADVQIMLYNSNNELVHQDQKNYYFNTNDSFYNDITVDQNSEGIYHVVLILLYLSNQVDQWTSGSFRLSMPILSYAYPLVGGNDVNFPFDINIQNGDSAQLEIDVEIYDNNGNLIKSDTGNFTFNSFEEEGFNFYFGQFPDSHYFTTMIIYYQGFYIYEYQLADFYVDQALSVQSVTTSSNDDKVTTEVSIFSGGTDTKISLTANLVLSNGNNLKYATYEYVLSNGENTYEIPFGLVQPGEYYINIQISLNSVYHSQYNSQKFKIEEKTTSISSNPSLPIPVPTVSILLSFITMTLIMYKFRKSKF